jgi:hypothetical protein
MYPFELLPVYQFLIIENQLASYDVHICMHVKRNTKKNQEKKKNAHGILRLVIEDSRRSFVSNYDNDEHN